MTRKIQVGQAEFNDPDQRWYITDGSNTLKWAEPIYPLINLPRQNGTQHGGNTRTGTKTITLNILVTDATQEKGQTGLQANIKQIHTALGAGKPVTATYTNHDGTETQAQIALTGATEWDENHNKTLARAKTVFNLIGGYWRDTYPAQAQIDKNGNINALAETEGPIQDVLFRFSPRAAGGDFNFALHDGFGGGSFGWRGRLEEGDFLLVAPFEYRASITQTPTWVIRGHRNASAGLWVGSTGFEVRPGDGVPRLVVEDGDGLKIEYLGKRCFE